MQRGRGASAHLPACPPGYRLRSQPGLPATRTWTAVCGPHQSTATTCALLSRSRRRRLTDLDRHVENAYRDTTCALSRTWDDSCAACAHGTSPFLRPAGRIDLRSTAFLVAGSQAKSSLGHLRRSLRYEAGRACRSPVSLTRRAVAVNPGTRCAPSIYGPGMAALLPASRADLGVRGKEFADRRGRWTIDVGPRRRNSKVPTGVRSPTRSPASDRQVDALSSGGCRRVSTTTSSTRPVITRPATKCGQPRHRRTRLRRQAYFAWILPASRDR